MSEKYRIESDGERTTVYGPDGEMMRNVTRVSLSHDARGCMKAEITVLAITPIVSVKAVGEVTNG